MVQRAPTPTHNPYPMNEVQEQYAVMSDEALADATREGVSVRLRLEASLKAGELAALTSGESSCTRRAPHPNPDIIARVCDAAGGFQYQPALEYLDHRFDQTQENLPTVEAMLKWAIELRSRLGFGWREEFTSQPPRPIPTVVTGNWKDGQPALREK
jgi:hypothetical protein